jgi:hypothetical protein
MSIKYYVGVEGPTIVVETLDDLHEALDLLLTQVDDAGLEDAYREPLQTTWNKIDDLLFLQAAGKQAKELDDRIAVKRAAGKVAEVIEPERGG